MSNPDMPFGKWLPDQAPISAVGTQYIRNAVPSATGWLPVPSAQDTGEGGITGTANILFHLSDTSRVVNVFAGDETKLYKLTTGAGFDNVSKAGDYSSAGAPWQQARYGDRLFMCNGVDPLQQWTLGVSTLFEDAAGIPNGLTGRYITTMRDFLVLGYTNDNVGVPSPYRVWWSALGDPNSWTPDPTTLAGYQDIPDLGEVRGITGGDYLTILMEKGIVRADFVGPPAIMQFDQIDGAVGCREPASVIRVKNTTYYYSPEGWMAFTGAQSQPIGSEKIDRWFTQYAKISKIDQMSVVNLPEFSAIAWSFESVDSLLGKPDKALIYSYDINEWGIADIPSVDCLGTSATPGLTVDQVPGTVDSYNVTVDSSIWKGDNFGVVSAIVNGVLHTVNGPTLDAELETIEVDPNKYGKAVLQGLIPHIHGDCQVAVDIGIRNATNTNVPIWYEAPAFQPIAGFVPLRHVGKFMRARMRLKGQWRHAVGIDIQGRPMGRR